MTELLTTAPRVGLKSRDVLRARATHRRLQVASHVVFGVGAVWVLLSALGVLGDLSDSVMSFTSIISLVTIVIGAAFNRPKPYPAWLCFLAMVLFFGVGGALRANMGTLGHVSADRSVLPDLFTFTGYALMAVGLIFLTVHRSRKLDIDGFIDAGVAALAVMLVTWIYLVEPMLAEEGIPVSIRLMIALYAPASVFLLALTFNYVYGSNFKNTTISNRYLIGALGMLFIGDVFYMLADTGFLDLPVRVLDGPYALAFILFPLGAMHPSVNDVPEIYIPRESPSLFRLGLVSAGLILPVIITLTRPDLSTLDQIVAAALLLGLTGLAVLKLFRALLAQRGAQIKLRYQATHDHLTALPNRAYAMSFLDAALLRARMKKEPLSVMFMDLDRFKYVNDTLGHAIGDALIREVGVRIRNAVPVPNLVARLGGDEFVVIAPDATEAQATLMAEAVQEAVSHPFKLGSVEVNTGVTVGVSSFQGEAGTTGASLIEDADTALYVGKENGRGRVSIFDDAMRAKVESQTRMESALRGALERNEFSVVYQPIVESGSLLPVGAEALVRWEHPVLGKVGPEQFIPVAEESGLIIEIGQWVLREACKEAAWWRANINPSFKVSVNVSARQLTETGFLDEVESALEDAGIKGDALDLEITESLLVAALERVASLLGTLKKMGVTLSVDDFGTGYSSLAYLKRFPVSRIKIDKSFTAGVTDANSSDPTLIAAIVGMGKALGMEVVAEGVETKEQALMVHRIGATYLQGYLLSRPLPSEEVRVRLTELVAGTSLTIEGK